MIIKNIEQYFWVRLKILDNILCLGYLCLWNECARLVHIINLGLNIK